MMRYQIEYGRSSVSYANGRVDLLVWLNLLKDEVITDIRKCYKNGVTDSVAEKYQNYIRTKPQRVQPSGSQVTNKSFNSLIIS